MLLGFGAAAIVEVLLCALLSGIHGMQLYAELLTSRYIEALSPLPALMINIYAIGENLTIDSPVLSGVLVVLTLGVTGIAVWKAPYWRSLAAAVAGSLLIAPHVFRYDASFLLWLFRVFSGWPTGSRLLHPADPTSPAVTSEPKRRPRNPQIPYTPVRSWATRKGNKTLINRELSL